jgi:hypothetical protein
MGGGPDSGGKRRWREPRTASMQPAGTSLPIVAYVCLGVPAALTGLLGLALIPQIESAAELFILLFLVAAFGFWIGMINPKLVPGAKGSRGRVIAFCGAAALTALLGFNTAVSLWGLRSAPGDEPDVTIVDEVRPAVPPAH